MSNKKRPSLPMISSGKDLERTNDDVIKEDIKKKVMPIFDEVLKEKGQNRVSVGGSVGSDVENYDYSFYNPHNCRFYFDFDKSSFEPRGRFGVGFRIVNSKELCLDDWQGCRFVVKKNLIEVTNKKNKDRLFKIEGNASERHQKVLESIKTVYFEAVEALKMFIGVWGGSSSLEAQKFWIPDNKILHDRIVDSLPDKMTFRNDVVKKVYRETPSNVEMSDPVFASNYFRNSGLRYYAPEIHSVLNELLLRSEEWSLDVVKAKIGCFEDVFLLRDKILMLNSSDRERLGEWIFERFGVCV